MDLLDDERRAVDEAIGWLEALAKQSSQRQTCGVAFYDGQPLFIGGYCEVAPGVVQVFCIPDRRIYANPKAFFKCVIFWRDWMQARSWCQRLQTHSLPTTLIDRWMGAIGFVCEGLAKEYNGTGQDYNLWSRDKLNGVWGSIRRRGDQ
jgi:hypothetical protein